MTIFKKNTKERPKPILTFYIDRLKTGKDKAIWDLNKTEIIILNPNHCGKKEFFLTSNKIKCQEFFCEGFDLQIPRIGEIVTLKGYKLLVTNVVHKFCFNTSHGVDIEAKELNIDDFEERTKIINKLTKS